LKLFIYITFFIIFVLFQKFLQMETGKKTIKTSITKRSARKSKEETEKEKQKQIYDADAELALALSSSEAEAFGSKSHEDFEYQQHLQLLKHQEEADAEYARQLAAEFESNANQGAAAANPNHHSNHHHNYNSNSDSAGADIGEDMDTVLEEIARMEAEERLKTTGHAYKGKTNINRVQADEDEEEARIREKVKRQNELNEWRAERTRQDAEYAAMEEYDRTQELLKKAGVPLIAPQESQSQPALATESETEEEDNDPEPEPEPEQEPEMEPAPLTKEELRKARLAFFTAGNGNQQKS